MSVFKKRLGVVEVKERLERFEAQIKAAEEERKVIREKLTAALATGSGDIPALQGRAAELDAVISLAPEARKLLENVLDEARAFDAAPKLKAVLAKIDKFRESLEEAGKEVDRAWQGVGSAIAALRGLEFPRAWGYRLKILFMQEDPPQHNPTIGRIGAEDSQNEGRAARATTALQAFRTELLQYCGKWETPLRGILASIDSEKPRKADPLSQDELMQQHRNLLHGKK